MSTEPKNENSQDELARKPYVQPELRRIALTTEETLAGGCKLGSDPVCVVNEPIFLPGS